MDYPNYILNEINKGIKMGMDSISTKYKKVQDDSFKEDLRFQYSKYNEILNKVNTELQKYGSFPEEVNPAQKAMGWAQIQWDTMNDKSNSNIAKMLIKGTNMGIIEGVTLLNQHPEADNDIKNILKEFIKFQENNVERLKQYL